MSYPHETDGDEIEAPLYPESQADGGEGPESPDELIGTENGCDEDEDGGFTPTHESPSYRQSMTDAGRGHLLP